MMFSELVLELRTHLKFKPMIWFINILLPSCFALVTVNSPCT